MIMMRALLARLGGDRRGAVVIETAIVTPVLLVMALGTYDVGQMVARQHKLQAGAADAESIVLAVANGTATDTTTIRSALANTLNMPESKITVDKTYRCNWDTTTATTNSCNSSAKVSTYVRVAFTDSYTPLWSSFGIGGTVNYNVQRTVQVG